MSAGPATEIAVAKTFPPSARQPLLIEGYMNSCVGGLSGANPGGAVFGPDASGDGAGAGGSTAESASGTGAAASVTGAASGAGAAASGAAAPGTAASGAGPGAGPGACGTSGAWAGSGPTACAGFTPGGRCACAPGTAPAAGLWATGVAGLLTKSLTAAATFRDSGDASALPVNIAAAAINIDVALVGSLAASWITGASPCTAGRPGACTPSTGGGDTGCAIANAGVISSRAAEEPSATSVLVDDMVPQKSLSEAVC